MRINSSYTVKNSHNKWVFKSLLWLLLFCILLFLFSDFPPKKIDYIYTFSYLLTLIFPVSITLYYFIPKFLKKEKYTLFSLLLIINILLFAYSNILFHLEIIDVLFPNYFFISYYNATQTILLFFVVVFITMFIKLAEDWVYFNQNEKLQIQSKLHALKGQINPHFLFNALNVLYSLSVNKNKEVTEAILQLSNILRYAVYNIDTQKVSTNKEVELINNYIAFEKNRHISNAKINFTTVIDKHAEISPMLLLPLVENSFKHGLKSGVENPYIRIQFHLKNRVLNFSIENNFSKIENNTVDEYSGIGLQNVQQNLEIIYPNMHTFIIDKTEKTHKVKLQVNLKR